MTFLNLSKHRKSQECLASPTGHDGPSSHAEEIPRPALSFLHQFDDMVRKTDIPRFLNEHKDTLRFPEMLLFLLVQAEREATRSEGHVSQPCIAWTTTGRAIIVRDKEELVNKLLPIAFQSKAKFASFARKMYRWGFRQVTCKSHKRMMCKAGEKIFWHPHFRRDDKPLILNMRSMTAEGTRRAMACQSVTEQKSSTSRSRKSPELPARQCFPHGRNRVNINKIVDSSSEIALSGPDWRQSNNSNPKHLTSTPEGDSLASFAARPFLSAVGAEALGMHKLAGRRVLARPVAHMRYVIGNRGPWSSVPPRIQPFDNRPSLLYLGGRTYGGTKQALLPTFYRVSGGLSPHSLLVPGSLGGFVNIT